MVSKKNFPRHQCLIYRGAPSVHLAGLGTIIQDKLRQNYRCLYLNSPAMVAGLRSALAATGVNVAEESASGRLVATSDQDHLVHGVFNPGRMLDLLQQAYDEALNDGYQGLWASGDMTWEFGSAQDFSRLMEYERGLEAFFRTHPAMCGVCQYHADILPHEVTRKGLAAHRALYFNETLSIMNPHYIAEGIAELRPEMMAVLDKAIDTICPPSRIN